MKLAQVLVRACCGCPHVSLAPRYCKIATKRVTRRGKAYTVQPTMPTVQAIPKWCPLPEVPLVILAGEAG